MPRSKQGADAPRSRIINEQVQVVPAHAAQDLRIAPGYLVRVELGQRLHLAIAGSLRIGLPALGCQGPCIDWLRLDDGAIGQYDLQFQHMVHGFAMDERMRA